MKRKAIFLLYRVCLALASPAILVYLLLRVLRDRRYLPSLAQRLGALPPSWQQTAPAAIWFHAVSVGEVLAAVPVIEELRRRAPRAPIFLSTSTLAGRETAARRLATLTDGIFFAPLDFVWCVRRVLRRIQPSVVVVLETEIWPNLFREATRLGCGLLIVNGRISDRALPRYRRLAPVFSAVLSLADRILVQSPEMQPRFVAAGAPLRRIEVAGNLKYDFQPAPLPLDSAVLAFLNARPARPLWIAASTTADAGIIEESIVLDAQRRLSGWRLILAPRQPARFDAVADLLAASDLRYARRSSLNDPDADVLLLDSIGELAGLFSHATAVFMGGTLANLGGHNILEPALFGKPIIAGPHLENFRDIEQHFEQRNALVRIPNSANAASDLAAAILRAAADPTLGPRALDAASEKRGATAKIVARILELYETRYPCARPVQPAYALLSAFSHLWRLGSAHDRRRKLCRQRRLPVPVVSIGNITAGGTGKTPVAIELLRRFQSARPGLLTRGYGRSTNEDVILLDRQPIALTGDEAQLIQRAISVPIGIGGNRFAVGQKLLAAAHPQLLVLDDGFQHLQLHRDFDLVLIDALRPFGGGHLIPLGRLREPLTGLARASAFVITRASEAPNTLAIAATLRRYNPRAPIFHAVTKPHCWRSSDLVSAATLLAPAALPPKPSIAFCGLGNPESFWRSLRALGIEPLHCYPWEDHHRYAPSEILRLARQARAVGAEVLLTTAKDAVNLPPDYKALIAPLELYWLEISIEFDRPDELYALITGVVHSSK